MSPDLSDRDRTLLRSIPLFANAERCGVVVARSKLARLSPGDCVVREGDATCDLYVILEGALEVSVGAPHEPKVLGVLRPGEWFGEEAILRGTRGSATVRALEASRCLEVPEHVFRELLLQDDAVRRQLHHHAEVRLAERSLRSLAFFADLDADEPIEGTVVRREVEADQVVFAAGTRAESMGFVIDGVARRAPNGGTPVRLGPGQCFGEQDVIEERPRTHDVVAETKLTFLEVRADRFRAWLEKDAELADWVGTLQHIHRLADGRLLTVYRAQIDGWPCAVTLQGDPSSDGVTTTDRIGQDHLVFARCRPGPGPIETVRFSDGERERELALSDVVRDERGRLRGGRLVRVEVNRSSPDVGQLYRRLVLDAPIGPRDLGRFRRTGHLGGVVRAADEALLCQCLQVSREDVGDAQTFEAVQKATGAGLICGGCRPNIERLVQRAETLADPAPAVDAPPAPPAPASPSAATRCAVPEVRERTFAFAREPLERIRAVPEMILIAVTSVLSTPAERLIIAAVGEAAPALQDRQLAAAAVAFLEQESNHIAAHAPLNELLLNEVYPYSGRLRRLAEEMLVRYRGRSLHERLAIAAAYEYASDAIFGAVFETHYRCGRRFHHDPAVHEALIRSGVGRLFAWHALEELSHRHVAFEVAVASGVSRRLLRWGMLQVVGDLARLQFPAALEIILREPQARLTGFLGAVFVEPGFVRTFGLSLVRWLRPDFDPGAERYDFLEALARDVDEAGADLP